ncbi:5-formyltetrahydrofolate cyclo-ligase [Patescibacteria group bacterium]|nr:5-formyltetrahydrofolate cyclo-ligase [Patescibacteria group bacterium]
MTPIALQKHHLRVRLKKEAAALSKETSMMWDKEICSHIFKLHNYQTAQFIALFIPLAGEPDIWPIIRDAWDRGKTVAVPRIEGKELLLKKIIGEKDLEIGPYRIRQPKPHQPIVPSSSIQLVFVPGIAFDKKRYRLGFGKGYYDRLLKTIDTRKIGVCYGFQLFDKLPHDRQDIKVDSVITEKGYIDTMI